MRSRVGDGGRWFLMAVALGGASSAFAWEPGAGRLLPWSDPVQQVAVQDGRLLIAGPDTVHVLDGATLTEVARIAHGALDLAAFDVQGDGVADLVLCSEQGVAWVSVLVDATDEVRALDPRPCTSVHVAGDTLVAVGEGVVRFERGPSRLVARVLDTGLAPPLVAAADGERVAVARVGGQRIVEHSTFGRSSYTARGPISALAAGPRSWIWSLRDEPLLEDVRRQTTPLSLPATALKTVWVDDDTSGLLVLRGGRLLLLQGDTRREIRVEHPVEEVAVGDADADGCLDLVLRGPTELTLTPGICARDVWRVVGAVEREVVLDPPEQVIEVFVGDRVLLHLKDPEGGGGRFGVRDAPEGFVIAEDGHGLFTPTQAQIGEHLVYVRMWGGASILRVVTLRLRVIPAAERPVNQPELAQLLLGSAPPSVRLGLGETLAVRLVLPGEPHATFSVRDGPEAMRITEQGLLTWSPAPDDVGQWEIALKVKGATVTRVGFRLDVLPRGSGVAIANAAQTRALVGGPEDEVRGFWTTQHCLIALGVAGGGTDATATWQDDEDRLFYSVSPVLGGLCEGGATHHGLRWFVGGETAPLFAYLLNDDNLGVHTLVGTAGFGYGNDRFFIGPSVSMGILMSGFGVRISWLPFTNSKGKRHGFEVRGTYIVATELSAQGMLLYAFRFGR